MSYGHASELLRKRQKMVKIEWTEETPWPGERDWIFPEMVEQFVRRGWVQRVEQAEEVG